MEGKRDRDFIVKIPAFNADGFYPDRPPESSKVVRDRNNAPSASFTATVALGQQLFRKEFGSEDSIRHAFNANSCVSCHANPIVGGFSTKEKSFVRRVSRYHKLTCYFNPTDTVTTFLSQSDTMSVVLVRSHKKR